jgi:ankyrin repeat protein
MSVNTLTITQASHPLSPFFQDEESQVFIDLILTHEVKEARAKIENGLDINKLQAGGLSYLTFCLIARDLTTFRLLLQLGANPDAICIEKNGMTPLMLAACITETSYLQACIAAGGNINQLADDGDSALILATACSNESTVRLLLAHGSKVNQQGAYMTSALHEAAQDGHEAIIGILLDAGADINLRDENGERAKLSA